MSKKVSAIILIISFIVNILFGCKNIENIAESQVLITESTVNEKKVESDLPYIYITNASTINEKNLYMNLNVTIPKIAYSNEGNDGLFDNINKELYDSVQKLIDESKIKAKETFESYIETAKNNIIEDKKNKLKSLLDKYESVLCDEDYEIVENIFFKNNKENKSTTSEVSGFTETENIIIDGLHNKRIIIVETAEAEITKNASNSNIVKPERNGNFDGKRNENFNKNRNGNFSGNANGSFTRQNNENITPENQNNQNNNINKQEQINTKEIKKSSTNEKEQNNKFAPQKNITNNQLNEERKNINNKNFKKPKFDNTKTIKSTKSEIKEITIENFYYELEEIRKIKIPNDRFLMMSYTPMEINCKYDIKCLDNEYLSLFVQIEETKTTTSYKRLYYNIDIINRKILKINDILGDNYKETCIEKINNDIGKWTNDKKENLKENYDVSKYINENTAFFINNNHKVVVELEKYAITKGFAGYQEFQIN